MQIQPFLKDYLDNNPDTREDLIIKLFKIYYRFKDKFKEAQGESDEDRKSTREFITLKQRTTIIRYIIDFQRLQIRVD